MQIMVSRTGSSAYLWYYVFVPFPIWTCVPTPNGNNFTRFIAFFLHLFMWLAIIEATSQCIRNDSCDGTGDAWFIALTCYCFAFLAQLDFSNDVQEYRRRRSTYNRVKQTDTYNRAKQTDKSERQSLADEDAAKLLLGTVTQEADAQNSVIAKARRKSKKDLALIKTFLQDQLREKIQELSNSIDEARKNEMLNDDERRILILLLKRNIDAAEKRILELDKVKRVPRRNSAMMLRDDRISRFDSAV